MTVKRALLQEDLGMVNVMRYAASPTAFNSATLAVALAAIGSTPTTLLLPPGAWTLTSSVSVPVTCTLCLARGAAPLALGGGMILTLAAPILCANPLAQFFSGAGTVVFAQDIGVPVRPEWWGAVGDGVTDATAALQAAVTAGVGATVQLSPGIFVLTNPVVLPQRTRLTGAGYKASVLHATHSGDALQSTWPVNSSTGAYIRVEHLGFTAVSGNTGAAFVDLGGTYVDLYALAVNEYRYGVIFDQTEIATINTCVFENQTTAGVWLVNGPDRTASAAYNFTNRITIARNQFNHGVAAYGLVDDGGVAHVIRDNNFNGGLQSIRICGLQGAVIQGNEIEASASTAMTLQQTTLAGTSNADIVSPRGVLISGNTFGPSAGQIHLDIVHAITVTLQSNFFGSDSTASPSRVRLNNTETLLALGNEFRGGPSNGGTYTGGATYQITLDGEALVQAVAIKPGLQLANPGTQTTGNGGTPILNWYEEGNFTPTLAGTGCTFQYARQTGFYVRIGSLLWFTIRIDLDTFGNTLTGDVVSITGLPFPSMTGTGNGPHFPVGFANLTTSVISLLASKIEGGVVLFLAKTTAAATDLSSFLGTDLHATNGSVLMVAGCYQVAP